ncbi:MAG: hypothetical protein HY711_05325, partial [Candidatus Melainabacteria bacterium]|nr:hypothetical protein [Candidatus Melainabacteria bacterium]
MCPAIAQKMLVEPKWPVTKVQEESAKALARQFMAAFEVLSGYGAQATEAFDKKVLQGKTEHYRALGVKTPLDLIKAMAESESNIFGSTIEIWGDDSKASLTYKACGMWNAIQKLQKMTPEMEEKMGNHFETCIHNLAKEFGFKAEVK